MPAFKDFNNLGFLACFLRSLNTAVVANTIKINISKAVTTEATMMPIIAPIPSPSLFCPSSLGFSPIIHDVYSCSYSKVS